MSEQPDQPPDDSQSEQPVAPPELGDNPDPVGGAGQASQTLAGFAKYGLPAGGVEDTAQQLMFRALLGMGDTGTAQSGSPLSLVSEPVQSQDASGASAGLKGTPDLTIPHPDAQRDAHDSLEVFNERLVRLEQMARRRPLFKDAFVGQATSDANGTTGNITFKEMYVTVSGVVTFAAGRSIAGNTTAIPLNNASFASNGTNVLLLAFDNGNTTQYAYLSIVQPAAKITGITSGSTPGPWVYKGVNPAGSNITIKNTMEPCNGTPGPLGVNVAANGTVGSGTCVVQSLGNMTNFCPAYVDSNGTYWVTIPNSAQ